ncbi:MAG: ATP phosphoribosyltransferase regulatory subunit [Clostridia bacterium]|nr:ATP phosphoribosyltransferase regulatory subunit [Clostridia bacterium]
MVEQKREEAILAELNALYKNYGYRRYKPSSFEEYALYQENKDFLIGKNVITFSDLSGKLMAVRPDVTLSLVRHNDAEHGYTEKYFYSEKVYSQSAGGSNYKEISQAGVEVLGSIDGAVVGELTLLICKTLATISKNYLVDLSHMGFTQGLLNEFPSHTNLLSEYLKSKNLHDFKVLAEKCGFNSELVNAFRFAVEACGSPAEVLKDAEEICLNDCMRSAVDELKTICEIADMFGYGDRVNINFSAVANADYYNGVIFNGYLDGVPHCVLSGGRYDKLLNKFKKSGGAIGFALYLGEFERYLAKDDDTVDYLIIYNADSEVKALELAQSKINGGESVRISTSISNGIRHKYLVDLTVGEEAK